MNNVFDVVMFIVFCVIFDTILFYLWWQERKDDQPQSGLRPIPAFEEHTILPNGLHEDAKPNFISVPLVDVDKSYEKQEVSLDFCLSDLKEWTNIVFF